jgi:hypothetical protein
MELIGENMKEETDLIPIEICVMKLKLELDDVLIAKIMKEGVPTIQYEYLLEQLQKIVLNNKIIIIPKWVELSVIEPPNGSGDIGC